MASIFLGWVARAISSATGSTPKGAGSAVTDSGVARTLAFWLSNSSTVSAPLSRNWTSRSSSLVMSLMISTLSGGWGRLGMPVDGQYGQFGDAADYGRVRFDEINLRQRACRTTGSPRRREVRKSLPIVQSEPVSLARLSTRPTHCVVQLSRLTPPRAHRGNAAQLRPPKLAPRVVSHPVQPGPSGPTPKSRFGRGPGDPGKEPTADVRGALGILHPTNRRRVESPIRPYPTSWRRFSVRAAERVSTCPRLGARRSARAASMTSPSAISNMSRLLKSGWTFRREP
jgi:hypothetical protein